MAVKIWAEIFLYIINRILVWYVEPENLYHKKFWRQLLLYSRASPIAHTKKTSQTEKETRIDLAQSFLVQFLENSESDM